MAGSTSGISPSFLGLSRSSGQVAHVLLTRSRLCPRASPGSSLHLHVLSTPPAFVLSQDQTLREELHKEPVTNHVGPPSTPWRPRSMTGYFSTWLRRRAGAPANRTCIPPTRLSRKSACC